MLKISGRTNRILSWLRRLRDAFALAAMSSVLGLGLGGGTAFAHSVHAAATEASFNGVAAFAVWLFGSRILYYGTLLPLLGWALWSVLHPPGSADRLAYWRRIGFRLQALHLSAFVLYVAMHWMEWAGDNAPASFLDTLRDTSMGQSWLFTGLLSLAGFPLLFRGYRFVDGGWAALVIVAKTLGSHAGSFEPVLFSRAVDAVHLAAAGLWIGGLLALALLLRKAPEWFRGFAPAFSTAALAAFAVLAVTGITSTLLYLERLSDILQTNWGLLLLGKTGLALAALPVAALLRRKLRKGDANPSSFQTWLRAYFALLVSIVALTGVLTHVNPIFERVTFHWHVMGETAHLTAEIADVRTGDNELQLKVWVPTGENAPSVSAVVVTPGAPDAAAELRASDLPSEPWESFIGFEKFTFEGDLVIVEPERAELRIRIQRENGETLDYAKTLIDP